MQFDEVRDRWIDLTQKKRELQGQLDKLNKEITALNPVLSDHMKSQGLQNFRIDGVGMVSLRTTTSASVQDRGRLKEVMEAHGLEGLLTVHTAKLKAMLNDPDTPAPLIDDLHECVSVSEFKVPSLRK